MRFLCALATLLVACSVPAAAQDKAGPTIEIRLKSINDLLDYAEYIGGLVGQEEQAKQAAGLVKAFAGAKGIEGIDPKRPFGAYATITPNVVDSPVVVMVPIADENTFVGLLQNRIGLDLKKGDNNVYELEVDQLDAPVYFRFAKGYAFATIRDQAAIADKVIIDPKAFFSADDPSVVSIAVHIDRIPADLRKLAFGQFEFQLNQEKAKKEPDETPAQHRLKGALLDAVAGAAHAVVTDGKTLSARLAVDPNGDELTLDVTLSAVDGSDFGKSLRSVANRRGLAPAAAAVANPVIAGAVNIALPAETVEKLRPMIDGLLEDAVESANPEDRDTAKKILDALAPTLKAGVAELGGAMIGPDADGHYRAVLALRLTQGLQIEKVAREFAPFVADTLTVEFDAAKAAGKSLHKIIIPNLDAETLFGTETTWWVIGDDIAIVGFEPDGAEVKRVAAAEPVGGEVVRLEIAAAAAAKAFEKEIEREELQSLVKEVFNGKPPAGRDTVRLTVTGGAQLHVKLAVKGRALRLFTAMDELRKQ
jgi:hypothetical protein